MQEENGGPYKASIPLSQATNPEADVLLAYEMNGEVTKPAFIVLVYSFLFFLALLKVEYSSYGNIVVSIV